MSLSIQNLSTFTGLSETELAKRAQDMVAAGKLTGLKALDAALVQGAMSTNQGAAAAMTAGGAQSAKPHVLEEPQQVLAHSIASQGDGFASAASVATPSLASAASSASLDKAAASGTAKVKGMVTGVADLLSQQMGEVELQAKGADSSTIAFEKLKIQMQRISEAFQMVTNVLNQTNDTSKSIINNVRA